MPGTDFSMQEGSRKGIARIVGTATQGLTVSMVVHFYDKSPSHRSEQRENLRAPAELSKANIPCVVYAEAALSIIHRVPTVLFNLQLLLHRENMWHAQKAICKTLPYTYKEHDEEDVWNDYRIANKDKPYAFNLNEDTLLLVHNNPEEAWIKEEPRRILLHASSVYHFDIDDPSKICLNPDPPCPEPAFAQVKFPTEAAFYDSLIDTMFSPPLPFLHQKFHGRLNTFFDYLSLYTTSDKGHTLVLPGDEERERERQSGSGSESDLESEFDDDDSPRMVELNAEMKKDYTERQLLPHCLDVLSKMRFENRPYLIRPLLIKTHLERYENVAMERHALRKMKDERYHIPDPPYPYHPFFRASGRETLPDFPGPVLTPFLIPGNRDGGAKKWTIEWLSMTSELSSHRLVF